MQFLDMKVYYIIKVLSKKLKKKVLVRVIIPFITNYMGIVNLNHKFQ